MVIKNIFPQSESVLLRITVALCLLGIAVHVAGYYMPSGLLWGINYFAFLSPYVLIIYVLCSLAINLFNLVKVNFQTGKTDRAIIILNNLIQIDERNVGAYENLSKAYYQSGDKEEAILVLRKAAQPGSKTAQYLLSMSGLREQ